MNHGDAIFQCLLGAFEADLFAIQGDGAAVLGVNAEKALHQSGFARAVLSHQGVDSTGPDSEIHAVQCLDAWKFLGDASHFQQCRLIHNISSFARFGVSA